MANSASDTLFEFLKRRGENHAVGGQKLFIRPEADPFLLSPEFTAATFLQSWRPEALRLAKLGLTAAQEPPAEEFDHIFFLPTKFRDENLYWFARTFTLLAPGGELICAMANDQGAKRFEDHLGVLFGNIDSWSKNHCRVFRATKGKLLEEQLHASWMQLGAETKIPGTDFCTVAGIFGSGAIDVGSRLLVEHLPQDLRGFGADFGAGYGYLSAHIVKNASGVASLEVFEAEALALAMSRKNVLPGESPIQLRFAWVDVVEEVQGRAFDFIVMNPPFHVGGEARPSIGEAFIAAAHTNLRSGGALYLVANEFIPYKKTLDTLFSSVQQLSHRDGFRVFKAFR